VTLGELFEEVERRKPTRLDMSAETLLQLLRTPGGKRCVEAATHAQSARFLHSPALPTVPGQRARLFNVE